jgi:hypothetical protein
MADHSRSMDVNNPHDELPPEEAASTSLIQFHSARRRYVSPRRFNLFPSPSAVVTAGQRRISLIFQRRGSTGFLEPNTSQEAGRAGNSPNWSGKALATFAVVFLACVFRCPSTFTYSPIVYTPSNPLFYRYSCGWYLRSSF